MIQDLENIFQIQDPGVEKDTNPGLRYATLVTNLVLKHGQQ
jgi:hypothetical protein